MRDLSLRSDHECPDAAIDRAIAELARQRFCGLCRCFFHSCNVASLDLIPQRGALAVSDRHIASRCGPAAAIHGVCRYGRKTRRTQVRTDAIDVMVPMGHACQETRRI